MKKTLVLAFVLAGLQTGCNSSDDGPSEVEACKELWAVFCDKVYQCVPAADRDNEFKTAWGLNTDDCKQKYQATECTAAEAACDSGEKWYPDRATQCLSGVKTLSCNDLMQEEIPTPAICDQVCSST